MHEALSEATLVRQARSGDRAAFDALVRRHFAAVYRMLHRLVGNHEDAEDLAQECFVRAWGALEWYDDRGDVSPWLRRIALHLARDHHRRRGRRPAASAEGLEALPDSSADGPQVELGRRELGARVRAGIEGLPERLRTAFVLRVLEGLEYDEVGRSTGVTPATARTHVMQARKRLLRWLAPWTGAQDRADSRGEGGER
jgi:RNA polymerase sigma-70 factor (ECF subfamily)